MQPIIDLSPDLTHRVGALGRRLDLDAFGLRARSGGRMPVHLLHIGKTGGTALKHVAESCERTPRALIRTHRHGVRLADIPDRHRIVLFMRDPLSRLVSGFYSRKRRGAQGGRLAWTPGERAAFARFDTPRGMAHGLASRDPAERSAAEAAMGAIQHVRDRYSRWLGSVDLLARRAEDLLFIGRTERMDEDFARLAAILAFPAAATLPDDPVAAHRAPQGLDTYMDHQARAALSPWLRLDQDILDFCEAHQGLAPLSQRDTKS